MVGVAVEARDPKRPTVHVVRADDAGGSASIVDTIDLPGDDEPLPEQLHHAAEGIRTYLKATKPDRVVVRQADYHQRAGLTAGRMNRLLVEGAITSAAISVVPDTRLATGKATGEWFGGQKADLDAAAKALVAAGSRHKRYVEAASAGLAGIALR